MDTRGECRIGWIGVRGCVGTRGGCLASSLCRSYAAKDKKLKQGEPPLFVFGPDMFMM